MPNQLVERGYLTQSLGSAAHSGEHGFRAVPGLLKRVIEERAWERRLIVETGEEFEGYRTFEAYVNANPPRGLGTDLETLRRLVYDNIELRSWIEGEIEKNHPKGKLAGINQYTKNGNGVIHPISIDTEKEEHDRSDKLLRHLCTDFPELYQRVLRNEITITDAAIQAKIYPPRIAVNLRDPESAAKTLLNHSSPEFLKELKRLLNNGKV